MFHTLNVYTISSHGYTIFITQLKSHAYIQRKQKNQDVKRLILTENEEILYSAYHSCMGSLIFYYVMICFISTYIVMANMASFRHTQKPVFKETSELSCEELHLQTHMFTYSPIIFLCKYWACGFVHSLTFTMKSSWIISYIIAEYPI